MMYEEWAEVDLCDGGSSPFAAFPEGTSRAVCSRLVADLARMNKAAQSVPSKLNTDEIVHFSLQVISYGLTLPFGTDYETIKECLSIYRTWINCTNPRPFYSIPRPIVQDPVKYSAAILDHIYQIFVPRYSNNGFRICGCSEEQSLRQTKECHQAMTFVQNAIQSCDGRYVQHLWPHILTFALKSCDTVLSEPFEPDDITTDHLGPRLLDALFDLWMQACWSAYFPSPNYWKTLRNRLKYWRHRPAVVDVWVRKMLGLTKLLLVKLYPHHERFDLSSGIFKESENVSAELVQQTWFRFFHILGDPNDVLKPNLSESNPRIREAMQRKGLNDICDHGCFALLPFVFYRQCAGIHLIVSLFMGIEVDCSFTVPENRQSVDSNQIHVHPPVTPQSSAPATILRQAFSAKETKVAREAYKGTNQAKNVASEPISTYPQASHLTYLCLKACELRWSDEGCSHEACCEIESLLQIFSDWLFCVVTSKDRSRTHSTSESRDDVSMKSSSSESNSLIKSTSEYDLEGKYQEHVHPIMAGKGEALAALCKLLSQCKAMGKLSKGYFIKFYAALARVLTRKDPLLVSFALFHGRDLFRLNLDGIDVLVPSVLDAILFILQDTDQNSIHPSLNVTDVRKSCLSIISSILCLPAYFGTHAVTDINCNTASHTFIGLRQKILKILLLNLNQTKEQENLQQTLALSVVFCEEMRRWEDVCSEREKGYYMQALQSVLQVISKQLHGWVSDACTCVAALHAMSALAHTASKFDVNHCRSVVSDLCSFVEHQLSRPHPAHSRDMHSTVVCALWTMQMWIVQAPTILDNQQILHKVTDVVELGIAGTVSKNGPVFDKKPASQRVHDVSEQLLYVLFCRSGSMYNPSNQTIERYLLLNGNCIAGFSKTVVDQNGSPSVILSVRNANLGLVSCKLRIQKEDTDQEKIVPRPAGVTVRPTTVIGDTVFSQRLNSMPKCKADSLPVVEVNDETKAIMDLIKKTEKDKIKVNLINPDTALLPPTALKDVDISRLLLEDLGFLDVKKFSENCEVLDSSSVDFVTDLETMIDCCSAKSLHSVYIYYSHKSSANRDDLLKYGSSLKKTSKSFRQFVLGLGKIVDVKENVILKNFFKNTEAHHSTSSGLFLDGFDNCVFWCTPLHDVCFVVPSLRTKFGTLSESGSETHTPPVFPKFPKKQVLQPEPGDLGVGRVRKRGFSLDPSTLSNQLNHLQAMTQLALTSHEEPVRGKRAAIKGFFIKRLPPLPLKKFAPTEQHRYKQMSQSQSRLRIESVMEEDSSSNESTSTLRSARSHENLHINAESLDVPTPVRPPRLKSASIDSADSTSIGKSGRKAMKTSHLVIVWVENLQDCDKLGAENLVPDGDGKMKSDHLITIFLHPLKTGLIRVKIKGNWGRLGCCGPLIDGCVISEQALPSLIQMTVLCFGRHRALEQELLLLPHIKRRQHIQKFATKYVTKLSSAETILHLLQG